NDASATGVLIGLGATVPQVKVTGSISVTGASKATSTSTALLIDTGASVQSIVNSGTIQANASANTSSATAIIDKSGQVAWISNSGTIAAAGGATGQNVAINVVAEKTGVTITQPVAASGAKAPSIQGDVLFGSGNNIFNVADGTVAGNTSFANGNSNLALSGD